MKLLHSLKELLGSDQIITEALETAHYSFDATPLFQENALAVVFPKNSHDVANIAQLCSQHKTAIVCRGSGTGLSGGSIPVKNSIVLCTLMMNKILDVDAENLCALVEPGVITDEINKAAAEHDLFFPPDPGSQKISTIGGNVAENSGGLRGLKYGVTRDYVMGLEVVLANGETIWTGNKCVKDVAGYSIKDLFIGSEGTLGIVTKVLLKLIPTPASKKTLLCTFSSMEQAAATVSEVIANKIIPCTCEFMDDYTVKSIEKFSKAGFPTQDLKALLLIECDGHQSMVDQDMQKIKEIAQKNHATQLFFASNEQEAEKLRQARRAAFSALAQQAPTVILEDATVPRNKLVEMVMYVQEIAQKYSLKIGCFGHMGDGNLHPTFLCDEKNAEEMIKVEKAMKEIFQKAIDLGGTITGEHGVGLAKKSFLPLMLPPSHFSIYQSLKKSFDPQNILNPGKVF